MILADTILIPSETEIIGGNPRHPRIRPASPVLCLADPTDPSAGPVSGANGAAGAGGGATGGGGTGGNGGTALVGLKSNSRPGGGRHEGSCIWQRGRGWKLVGNLSAMRF